MAERRRFDLRRDVASMVWNKFCSEYGFENLNPESLQNLTLANEQLHHGGVVIYSNHTDWNDAFVITSFAVRHLLNGERFMAPVGMKYFDWRRHPHTAVMYRAIQPLGLMPLPVVQHNDRSRYDEAVRLASTDKLKSQTGKYLTMPGTVYGILPEGTRTSGELIQAQNGLGKLKKYDPDHTVFYVPLAVVYGKYNDGQAYIEVGKPKNLLELMGDVHFASESDVSAQDRTDRLMMELAAIIPPQMRGYYGKYFY